MIFVFLNTLCEPVIVWVVGEAGADFIRLAEMASVIRRRTGTGRQAEYEAAVNFA